MTQIERVPVLIFNQHFPKIITEIFRKMFFFYYFIKLFRQFFIKFRVFLRNRLTKFVSPRKTMTSQFRKLDKAHPIFLRCTNPIFIIKRLVKNIFFLLCKSPFIHFFIPSSRVFLESRIFFKRLLLAFRRHKSHNRVQRSEVFYRIRT